MLRGSIVAVVALTLSAAAQVSSAPTKPTLKVMAGSLTSRSPSEAPNIQVLLRGTRVVVHATITKTGEVTDIQYVKGNRDLMPSVLKNLKTWKYKPYIYEGQPVEVESFVDIDFHF